MTVLAESVRRRLRQDGLVGRLPMRTPVSLAVVPAVVALGLAVRAVVPGRGGDWGGVVLYAVLVSCLVSAVAPRATAGVRAAAAIVVCWAIELFQLTPIPAAASEASVVGRLVLGSGFQWADIACYAVGVALAALVDVAISTVRRADRDR